MCVNYTPLQRKILRDIFGVEPPPGEYPPETWPDYLAPIVRADSEGNRASVLANFQFIPKKRIPPGGRKIDTTNARSETVGQLKTFSGPWKSGQLCLILMHSFFEPNYEAGPKSVRYRIWLKDEPSFAVAGLWRDWPDGLVSFTMLTANADKHPLMSRMHAPGTEKRSVVIVPRDGWDDWLTCRDPETARTFMGLYPAQAMDSEPAPVPPRSVPSDGSLPLF
jgi:putative SOS response-associated peptidase YedK